MENKLSINDIAYCGINCRMCNLTTILPEAALKLYQIMKDDSWELFGSMVYPEFEDFWKVLYALSGMKDHCPMCKGGCGDPDCKFRICAKEKGHQLCVECTSFPCEGLNAFYTNRYPYLLQSMARLKEIGAEAWLTEQQELVDKGLINQNLSDQSNS